MSGKNVLLKISDLSKEYDPAQGTVLRDIDLEIYEEDFLCILGPSGCGKSTLVRCIAGFEEYEGGIEIDGRKVTQPGPDRVMVFQNFDQLFPWKTVLGNITYPLKISGVKDSREREEKAEAYLKKVRLLDYKDYYPHQLSGGMKQRVAIARGMALGSRVMLMDEPFAALDAITRNQMQRELANIQKAEKLTILFITHNIQEAIIMGNRIAVMSREGQIREYMDNPIQQPVTPASPGYGELWTYLNEMLNK